MASAGAATETWIATEWGSLLGDRRAARDRPRAQRMRAPLRGVVDRRLARPYEQEARIAQHSRRPDLLVEGQTNDGPEAAKLRVIGLGERAVA